MDEHLARDPRGDLPGGMASHAIEHGVQTELWLEDEHVLVARTAAAMGLSSPGHMSDIIFSNIESSRASGETERAANASTRERDPSPVSPARGCGRITSLPRSLESTCPPSLRSCSLIDLHPSTSRGHSSGRSEDDQNRRSSK